MYYNLVYVVVVDGIANVVVGFFDNIAMGLDDVAGDGGDGGEAFTTRPFLQLLLAEGEIPRSSSPLELPLLLEMFLPASFPAGTRFSSGYSWP